MSFGDARDTQKIINIDLQKQRIGLSIKRVGIEDQPVVIKE